MDVVDLFCGIGGFSEGARRAGHRVVMAVDADATALATHRANHRECARHVHATLPAGLPPLPTTGRWHLHASPPCQSLSQANRRRPDAPAGLALVAWYLALVERARPTTWSLEQVATPATVGLLAEWRARHPATCDYEVVWCYRYGVPQNRNRLVAGSPELVRRLRARADLADATVRAALPDAPTAWLMSATDNTPDRHGGHRPLRPEECMRPTSRPSYTVLTSKVPRWVRADGEVVRRLTPRECARLQTFPDAYELGARAYRGVGNAMPVELARRLVQP